jgi:uncharacterized protein YndB with AHSA1/START domain
VTDPAGGAFTLTMVFEAPRDLVWKAWTEPDQLARWWGPHGLTTPLSTIEVDLRPGGAFRLTMVSDEDGASYTSEMEFREVLEPERLVFAWASQRGLGPGMVTVTLRDLGGRTEMTCHYVARHPGDIYADVRTGWSEQFERLARHIESERTGGAP